MISLRPELEELVASGQLDAEAARLPVALEDREIVSVHGLVRFVLWAGVAMIVGGAGLWFRENLEQLGPAVVTLVGAILAATAYAAAWLVTKRAASNEPSLAAEYLGLLAALLLSADVAWAESQFVILANWTHHLLILAAIHATYAYLTSNRLVLTVAVTSLVAWFGIEQEDVLDLASLEGGVRLLAASGAVLLWRLLHLRARKPAFENVLENFSLHLGFWASLVWLAGEETQILGLMLLLVLVAVVTIWVRETDASDLQMIWAGIYGLIGVDILIIQNVDDGVLITLWMTISSLAAIFGLIAFFINRRSAQ